MEIPEYLSIVLIAFSAYFTLAILMWFVNIYRTLQLFRRQYKVIDPNETYSLDSIQALIQKHEEIGELDIKIFSSSLPQIFFLEAESVSKQVFEKPTLLISSRLYNLPFTSKDREGMLGFIIHNILRIKHLRRIQTRNLTIGRALGLLILVEVLLLLPIIMLISLVLDVQFALLFWLMGNHFLILRNGRNELKLIYEADNFAYNLTKDYPDILQKFNNVQAAERSGWQKLLSILLVITWVKPIPAVAVRLKRLNPLQEDLICPQCSKKIPKMQSWCPHCQFKLQTSFEYLRFILWTGISGIILMLLPVMLPGIVEGIQDDFSLVLMLYSFICIFLMALATDRIHFRTVISRKPKLALLTGLLGIVLLVDVLILFMLTEELNLSTSRDMQYFFASFLTGYIMGGFVIFYLVLEYRFK